MSEANNFGRNLKWHRLDMRMTQQRLADLVKTSRYSVCNYERGVQSPSLDMAEKLARAVGVKLSEILT